MSVRSYLESVKNWIKHRSTFHRQGPERNILIFSTARSGTTWLAEMLATQGRFKIVNEPFNLRIPVKRESLGLGTWESLLLPENRTRMTAYLQSFHNGGDKDIRHKRETPFSRFWHLRTDRIIYKILFACENDIAWFANELGGQVVVLLRHPVPVSLSRDEFPRLDSFLIPPFCENFTPAQLASAHEITDRGSTFEKAVLDWCLQNAIPLRQYRKNWLVLSYEQLVIQPELAIKHLTRHLALPDPQRMLSLVYQASSSTTKSKADSRSVLLDREKLTEKRLWLVQKWKEKVTPQQEAAAYDILKTFDIDFYGPESFLPANRYLLPPLE